SDLVLHHLGFHRAARHGYGNRRACARRRWHGRAVAWPQPSFPGRPRSRGTRSRIARKQAPAGKPDRATGDRTGIAGRTRRRTRTRGRVATRLSPDADFDPRNQPWRDKRGLQRADRDHPRHGSGGVFRSAALAWPAATMDPSALSPVGVAEATSRQRALPTPARTAAARMSVMVFWAALALVLY